MSYIGKEPQVGAYNMLDSLTASATASYSLTLDSTAFVPESANHLLVSLNGVIQKAGSSYTVSGSTLTFSSSLASSDSIDFVLALGNVLDIGTPSDATVTNAKTNFVSTSSAAGLQIKGDNTTAGTLQLNCEQNSHGIKLKSPAHSASASYTLTFPTTDGNADEFLQTDGSGVLSWASAGGITHYWSASRNSGQSVAQNTATNILWNVVTTATGITNTLTSNGRITIPSGGAGWYVVTAINRYADGPTGGKEKLTIQWYDTSASSTESIGYAEMNTSGTYDTKVASGLKYLDVGDYVYVQVNQNNDSSANFIGGNGTGFYGFKIA